jgi:hypothetical protein
VIDSPPLPELDPESYHHNVVRLELPHGTVDLEPADGRSCAVPFAHPLYVFSVWNPYGRPSTLHENLRWAGTEAGEHAQEPRIPAAIYPSDLRFAEQAVAVTDLDEDVVQTYTERFGQPALFRWDAEGLHVLRTADMEVVDSWAVRSTPMDTRTCLMEPGRVEGTCTRRGGPWVSASIEAAFLWHHEFTCKFAALLGCQLCDGRPLGVGDPIGLVELSVPSRFSTCHVVGPA